MLTSSDNDIALFLLQLAFIIIVAHGMSFLVQRLTRLPGVIGELAAGMLIGPYALGQLRAGSWGPLFPMLDGFSAISPTLYGMVAISSIILLFTAGLETDVVRLLRYARAWTAVGLGGVLLSFFAGDACAVVFGLSESMTDPAALFMGTISTATSIGITARILGTKGKMNSPEGVTIMASALLDDVFCIVLLTVAASAAALSSTSGSLPWQHVGFIILKLLAIWFIVTLFALALARTVSRILKLLGSTETIASAAFGLALLLAGLSEAAGLAMIVGAFIMGMALSRTDLARVIRHQLQPLYAFFVPIFFCVMGMLFDFRAIGDAWAFGIAYMLVAIGSKIAGCYIPARLTLFNNLGSLRVGVGMAPRGEVALIVASTGLASGALPSAAFGATVIMVLGSTLLTPILFAKLLSEKEGLQQPDREASGLASFSLHFPMPDIANFMAIRMAQAFRDEGFMVQRLRLARPTFRIQQDAISVTIAQDDSDLVFETTKRDEDLVRMIAMEELLKLKDVLEACRQAEFIDDMENDLAGHLFADKDRTAE